MAFKTDSNRLPVSSGDIDDTCAGTSSVGGGVVARDNGGETVAAAVGVAVAGVVVG